eukprot:CAMPEP_0172725104 /NCGR_PEP_ID=MMETSP1074-20121228/87613_1 /TAXON_ID=2916 /ORGANISM="Ceratium fusus, Strain PA161109" /LENGTH=118 /DNA_ID=CAMNT_0013551805 /DNA_START=194 /DNA_END=551 /DNA_ORIENTATION=-
MFVVDGGEDVTCVNEVLQGFRQIPWCDWLEVRAESAEFHTFWPTVALRFQEAHEALRSATPSSPTFAGVDGSFVVWATWGTAVLSSCIDDSCFFDSGVIGSMPEFWSLTDECATSIMW